MTMLKVAKATVKFATLVLSFNIMEGHSLKKHPISASGLWCLINDKRLCHTSVATSPLILSNDRFSRQRKRSPNPVTSRYCMAWEITA